jgi:hypothetical protein
MDEQKTCVTILVCNALARYCAPSMPISFPARSNVVSVCVEQNEEYAIHE